MPYRINLHIAVLEISFNDFELQIQLSFNYDYDLYFVAHSSIYTTTAYGKLL